MNAVRLLAHYEKIAKAPDAVARLRRFILDLAVRGKLVPQDSSDEPASELLKRIAKEKLDEADLPKGWRKAKVGSILDFQYGKGLKASERLDEGPVPVFGSNGVVGYTDEPLTALPSIIVGRKGSAGALNLCDGPSWTTDVAYFVEAPSFLDLRFLYNALAALDLDRLGKGVKPGLSRSEAYEQIISLPPLAEQRRIVAKVDELMALCDRLEAARTAREATRDRLAGASLARLNAPDPETFQADARFALDALPALTTRPDQIQQLRRTILSLAVRGSLVPQDSSSEPVSSTFMRIRREMLPKPSPGGPGVEVAASTVGASELRLPLPMGWAWQRIDALVRSLRHDIRTGPFGSALHKADHRQQGIPVWGIESIAKNGIFKRQNKIFVTPEKARELSSFSVKGGDIIVSRSGTVGEICRVPDDAPSGLLSTNLMKISLDFRMISSDYFCLLFKGSDSIEKQLTELCSGSTRLFLTQGILEPVFN